MCDFVVSRDCWWPGSSNYRIALKYDWSQCMLPNCLSVKIQSGRTILNSNLAASRLHEILWLNVLSDIETGPSRVSATSDTVYIWKWLLKGRYRECHPHKQPAQIAKFMGPTWGPPGSCRPQMGPMLAPWTLLSGRFEWFLRCGRQTEIKSVDESFVAGAERSTVLWGSNFLTQTHKSISFESLCTRWDLNKILFFCKRYFILYMAILLREDIPATRF